MKQDFLIEGGLLLKYLHLSIEYRLHNVHSKARQTVKLLFTHPAHQYTPVCEDMKIWTRPKSRTWAPVGKRHP